MLLRGFESRLGLESSGCSMWHFLKLVARGFLRVLRFPPLLHRFNGSANQINTISTLSNLIADLSLCTKWHITWHLHVISARCVARDLHTVVPGPLEHTCCRQFTALWGDCKKSRIAPLNAIITIIIIIIFTILTLDVLFRTHTTGCVGLRWKISMAHRASLEHILAFLPLSTIRNTFFTFDLGKQN